MDTLVFCGTIVREDREEEEKVDIIEFKVPILLSSVQVIPKAFKPFASIEFAGETKPSSSIEFFAKDLKNSQDTYERLTDQFFFFDSSVLPKIFEFTNSVILSILPFSNFFHLIFIFRIKKRRRKKTTMRHKKGRKGK